MMGEEMIYDNVDIVEEDKEKEIKFVDPYNDPNDPSLDDIKKNTQDIVLNDITMPVMDEPSIPEPKPEPIAQSESITQSENSSARTRART